VKPCLTKKVFKSIITETGLESGAGAGRQVDGKGYRKKEGDATFRIMSCHMNVHCQSSTWTLEMCNFIMS
jgi:hypothetical protein